MAGMSDPTPILEPSEIETREQFADALTVLRTRAGLSIRGLAQRLAMPTATIGDYCSGRHLPGPGQQEMLISMLRAFGVEESQLDAWLDAVGRLRAGSDGRMRRVTTPYKGLMPFDVGDQDRFFGREDITDEILERLRAQVATETARGLILVLGPSGAGKSSLLRAGVQARIEDGALGDGNGSWSTGLMTPGENPLEALSTCLAELPEQRRAVIVDQLEEIFAGPAGVQDGFLRELNRLAGSGTPVLAGLRADFYEQALRSTELLASLRADPVLLAPMSEEELRSAISGPARYAGVQLEDGLVEVLIGDLAPRDATGFAHDAGSLPLLSHALLKSWERARGNRLTVADYRAAGGLRGSVRQTAEELYTQLTDDQQQVARRMFMRLVRASEDGPAVRRRARRDELVALGDADPRSGARGSEKVEAVIGQFVDARLITVDVDSVELSHEALLTAWPRLAAWIEENRAGLRLQSQLTDAANDWVAADQDPTLLLRGARLQLIGEWASEPENRAELNTNELALLEESQQLELRRRRTTRRRARQMRGLATASLISTAVALALAAVALHANQTASTARDNALSRQIALQAGSVTPTDPSLAMQLAVLAHKIAPTTNATSALLEASSGEMPTRVLGPTGPAYVSASASADRIAVAYSAADRIRIYELERGLPRLITTIAVGPASAQLFAVALSPNGQLLAAGGSNHQVMVWSLASLKHPTKLATLTGLAGTVYGLSFSADGSQLAAVDDSASVELWSLGGASRPRPMPALSAPTHTDLHAVQFGPSGHVIAAASATGEVLIWPQTGQAATPVSATVADGSTLTTLAFSPDGHTLVAGGEGSPVYRWTLNGAHPPTALAPLHGFTSWVDSLAFSPDGRYVVGGGSDNSVRIWSATGPLFTATLGHPAAVTGVAFADGGRRLLSLDATGTMRDWSFPPPAVLTAPGKVFGLDYTTGGNELAVISSGAVGNAELWNTTDAAHPTPIAPVADPRSFGAVAGAGALTGNGRLLAVANARAQVQLFDVSDPHHPRALGRPLLGATPYIEQMAFDPGGQLLAAGDDGGSVHLWDVARPTHPIAEATLHPSPTKQSVLGVAFSPNGHLLATAGADGRILLWTVVAPSHPRLLATVGHFNGYAYTVAFTPNGRTLAAGGANQTVRLWNISNPTHPKPEGAPLTGPTSSIYDVAVNADGSLLAAATTDGFVWLWNISSPTAPQVIADLAGSSTELFSVSFQPHADTVTSAGSDQLLHIWDDNPRSLASHICEVAGTSLTRAEWNQYVQAGQYTPPCR